MQHLFAPRTKVRACLTAALLATFTSPLVHAATPVITGTPVTTIRALQPYSFQPKATDADGDKLTFSIAKKPPWATFSTSTGKLSGTPAAADARAWSSIVISVTDGKNSRALPAFTILVRPALANQPPTISGTPATTAKVGTAYSFQPTGKDPEGATLKWSIANKPAWLTFSTSTGKLSGTPASSNVGTASGIKITVSDGTSSVSLAAFSITVSASGSTNSPPVITGTPPGSIVVGSAYSFKPTASDANNDALTFSIAGKPSWASFSTTTGQLSGTPTSANLGTSGQIVISVSDGKASASLSGFAITVTQSASGSAQLNWSPPLSNTDGSTLTNLAGYRISYGTSASALSQTQAINNVGLTSFTITNLSPGTWYFAIQSVTTGGTTSALSNPVSLVIR